MRGILEVESVKLEFNIESANDRTLSFGSQEKNWGSQNDDMRLAHILHPDKLQVDIIFQTDEGDIEFAKNIEIRDLTEFLRALETGARISVDGERLIPTKDKSFTLGIRQRNKGEILLFRSSDGTLANKSVVNIDHIIAQETLFDEIVALQDSYDELITQLEEKPVSSDYYSISELEEIAKVIQGNNNIPISQVNKALLQIRELKLISERLNEIHVINDINDPIGLDSLLKRYAEEISEEVLIHLIEISLRPYIKGGKYAFALLLIDESIRRKSLAAQFAIVDVILSFQSVSDLYGGDSGDENFDSIVPFYSRLDQAALARVLLGIHNDLLLSHSEVYVREGHFYSFFNKVKDSRLADKVFRRFISYAKEEISSYGNDGLEMLIGRLRSSSNSVAKKFLPGVEEELSGIWADQRSYDSNDIEQVKKRIEKMTYRMSDGDLLDVNLNNELFNDSEDISYYKAIEFNIHYQLFLRFISKDEQYHYSNTVSYFQILFAYDTEQLVSRLVDDVQQNSKIKNNVLDYLDDFRPHRFGTDERKFYLSVAIIRGILNGKTRETIEQEENDRWLAKLELAREHARKDLLYSIRAEYRKAMDDKEKIPDFLNYTKKKLEESSYSGEYPYEIADYTTKLLLNRLTVGDYSLAEEIFNYYADYFLPQVGLHEKTSDVASIALVLSIVANKENVARKVFDKLLEPDFDIASLENSVLLFNLASYYALHQDKTNLLLATKQAMVKGKRPEDFLNDPDFNDYLNDEDFLTIIKGGE